MTADFPNTKTVYGPVPSWRFGESLGIDPIFHQSTCSFNCIYCQLGNIEKITNEIKEYVPTSKVVEDFKEILDKKIDVITYSGSGEPTLAANLGEMVISLKEMAPEIPQFILTNATELGNPLVQENLKNMDKVIIKLDAGDEKTFSLVNRPAEGITLKSVVEGIKSFRKSYKGSVEVQTMFMPIINSNELEAFANILKEIGPEYVQLNTPKRAYPLSWHRENRGNHLGIHDHQISNLKVITKDEAIEIKKKLEKMTGLNFYSIYK
ncbi:MAG: radical SAM protein [Deltaproteobacteria bacterium]|nr:MAG: radical SAM protein [Deltaproteobacteria bacterium]